MILSKTSSAYMPAPALVCNDRIERTKGLSNFTLQTSMAFLGQGIPNNLHLNFERCALNRLKSCGKLNKGRNYARCSMRETKTPHSGCHFDGSSRRFFEGWYFKISIPETKKSFAFIYSLENPGSENHLVRPWEEARFRGVGVQVMGPDDEYIWQFDESTSSFWSDKNELALGHTFLSKTGVVPRAAVEPSSFLANVAEGFQTTATLNQGRIRDNGRSPSMKTVPSASWQYSTRPLYGWGDQGGSQKATAGWLAALPVFEPHWQICMAAGFSTGWVEWGGEKTHFVDAPSYVEKNWGGGFPQKWFWVQCNVFEGVEEPMALTAGGGRRGLPLGVTEEIAMVGVHYRGKFFEFVPWKGSVQWEVATWGSWKMSASSATHEVELEAISPEGQGTILRAPTADSGLVPMCKDTFDGDLTVSIWERLPSGRRGKLIVEAKSQMAALEVGGGPWWGPWANKVETPPPLAAVVGADVDVGSLFAPLPPVLQPPGL